MYKIFALIMALLLIAGIGVATAADLEKELVVKSVVVATDSNGSPYVRVIVEETRKKGSIEYKRSLAAMGFASQLSQEDLDKLSSLQPGDTFKAVVEAGEYRGRENYTILAIQ